MDIGNNKQTWVAALIMSLMFVRCEHGSPSLTSPWGLTARDIEVASDTVTGWANDAQQMFAQKSR